MATYKLIGQRNLRKYTEAKTSPTYAAAIEAQTIVDSLCQIPWKKVSARDATMTYHTEETVAEIDGQKINGLEMNVRIRDEFDAALFCADHTGGQHRAYANAAVYHYVLPDGALPKLTKLVAKVTSDPYNAAGARIAILTNETGEIPTNCNECRTGDAHADGVAPRTVAANGNWFPTMADCVFSATPGEGETALPSGGLQLQKHLFVFVLMESYSTVRGNWLEGCSFIKNLVEIETDDAVPGWTDGAEYDCTGDVGGFGFMDVANMGFTKLFDMAGEVRYVGKASLTKDDVTHDFLMVCGDFADQDEVSFRDFVMYDLTAGRILDMSGALTANPNLKRAFDLGWKLCSVHHYLQTGSMDKDLYLSFNFDRQDPYNGQVFEARFNIDLSNGVCSDFTSFPDLDIKGSPCGILIPTSDGVRVDKANGLVVTIGHWIDNVGRNESERRIKVGDGLERAEYEGNDNRDESSYTYTRTVIAYGSFDAIGEVQTGNVAKLEYKGVTGNGETYERTVQSLFGPIKVSVDNVANLMAFRISSPKFISGIVESWLLIGEFRRINGLVCENAAIINIIEESDKALFSNGDASAIIPLVMPQFGIALAEVERMSYGRITFESQKSSGRIYYKK